MAKSYTPVFLVSHLQYELNRLFQETLEVERSELSGETWSPRLDVVELDSKFLILAEVPGLGAEELKVEVKGNLITITGSKVTPMPPSEGAKFHCMERARGRFRRQVRLSQPINTHHGVARLAHGLLIIEFPKIEDKRERSMTLKVRSEEGKDG